MAIASDHSVEDVGAAAVFSLDDTVAIADFIAATVGLGTPSK